MKWGLALGGGGVPGVAAHLGFMAQIEQAGLMPDVLVGASGGGLVAGGLARGQDLASLTSGWTHAMRDPWRLIPDEAWHLVQALRPRSAPGLISLGTLIAEVYDGILNDTGWLTASWREGWGVVVSDLTAARSVLVTKNSAPTWDSYEALTATAAFPGLLSGVRRSDGHLYGDGGLYDQIPVQACRDLGAERVVAVQIGTDPDVPALLSVTDLLHLVISRALVATDAATNPAAPDLRIVIPASGSLLDMHAWDADLAAGQRSGYAAATQIQDLLRPPAPGPARA